MQGYGNVQAAAAARTGPHMKPRLRGCGPLVVPTHLMRQVAARCSGKDCLGRCQHGQRHCRKRHSRRPCSFAMAARKAQARSMLRRPNQVQANMPSKTPSKQRMLVAMLRPSKGLVHALAHACSLRQCAASEKRPGRASGEHSAVSSTLTTTWPSCGRSSAGTVTCRAGVLVLGFCGVLRARDCSPCYTPLSRRLVNRRPGRCPSACWSSVIFSFDGY